MRKKLTPYQKIKRAALNLRGVRLTADECEQLYYVDRAIQHRADMDDTGIEEPTAQEIKDAGSKP